MAENLQTAGMEYSRLQNGAPYSLHSADNSGPRHSWVDTSAIQAAAMTSRPSNTDIQSMNDNESVNSSPGVQRRGLVSDFSFTAMKLALAEPTEAAKREKMESQKKLNNTFRNANFEDLIRRTEPKHEVIQAKLSELFNSLATDRQMIGQAEQIKATQPNKTIYENTFPELFFY